MGGGTMKDDDLLIFTGGNGAEWIGRNVSPYETDPLMAVRESADAWVNALPPESIDEKELESILEEFGLND
jgi:hypothetical protein